jgi:N-acetylglucosamine-6-sulfatase
MSSPSPSPWPWPVIVLIGALAATFITTGAATAQARILPNIIFILTDDQDVHMDSLEHMPLVNKHLIDRGTVFKRHFCTTAVCCPSRATLLTGKAAHNTNVTDLFPPYGM